MKLLKFSEEHYIICDDSEIKQGDWYYIPRTHNVYQCEEDPTELNLERHVGTAKVTHSTEPIEFGWGQEGRDIVSKKIYNKVNRLSLPEVKELLGLVDVKKKAEEFYEFWYDKYGTSEIDTIERNAVSHGFWGAYNQSLEDNKEKKYTEEDMVEWTMCMIAQYVQGNTNIWDRDMLRKSLPQPKTEWDVEIIDGKLKLK